jgi:glycosyltransferase involved in cell wall biosynthesis
MKILVALTYYRPHYSGLTIYAERAARALAERGHQITVLTSRYDRRLPTQEQLDGVKIIRPNVLMRISKGVIMPGMLTWALRLIPQVDVVNLHVPQLDAAPLALLSRLLGKPVVMTYHCDLHLPSGVIHRMANLANNLANHLTAWSANLIIHNTRDYATASPFLRRYLSKVEAILPPVELAPVTPADREAFRQKFGILPGQRIIGMAARLATEKGVEYLARALPVVLERFPTARVLFVGPYLNIVGEEAYARRIAPNIEPLGGNWSFLGILSPVEMSAFFHECEVTVLPSINSTESMGIVQIESLTCGTPVIASDRPGVRVPVRATGSGLLVAPRDAPALAQALIQFLENPARYQGSPAALVQKASPAALAEAYEAVFRRLLTLPGCPSP